MQRVLDAFYYRGGRIIRLEPESYRCHQHTQFCESHSDTVVVIIWRNQSYAGSIYGALIVAFITYALAILALSFLEETFKKISTIMKRINAAELNWCMNTSTITLKKYTEADIPAAMRLSEAEGWNQTQDDWKLFTSHAQNVCMLATTGNKIIGTTTAINYANELAWLAMVLVEKNIPGQRHQQIAAGKCAGETGQFQSNQTRCDCCRAKGLYRVWI